MNFSRKLFGFFVTLAVVSLILSLIFLFQEGGREELPAEPGVGFLARNYKRYLGSAVTVRGKFEACLALSQAVRGDRSSNVCFLADPFDSTQKIKVSFNIPVKDNELLSFGVHAVRGVVEASTEFWYGAAINVTEVVRVD